jgi:hypothetical protein
MGTKLECEVDVEGAVDVMDRGEEWDSWRWTGQRGTTVGAVALLGHNTVQLRGHEAAGSSSLYVRSALEGLGPIDISCSLDLSPRLGLSDTQLLPRLLPLFINSESVGGTCHLEEAKASCTSDSTTSTTW